MEAAEEKHEIAKNKIKRELTKLWTGELALLYHFGYDKIRLSYSYNPLVLLKRIKNGKLSKSRLAKEISDR